MAINEVLTKALVGVLSFPEFLENKLNPIVDTKHTEKFEPGYSYSEDIVRRRNGEVEISTRAGTLAGVEYVRLKGRTNKAGELRDKSASGIIYYSDGDAPDILKQTEATALIEDFLEPIAG